MECYHDGFSQEHAKTYSDDGTSLKGYGYYRYKPRVINQMLEFAFWYIIMILDDAKFHSGNAKNATVYADDVKLAIQYHADQPFTSPQEIFY